jgi:predicted Holliday junction resolvase-like endonuclease
MVTTAILCAALIFVGYLYIRQGKKIIENKAAFEKASKELADWAAAQEKFVSEILTDHDNTKAELKKVKSQKKSSEVRTGLIAEQMAPFLDDFPYCQRSSDIVFMGRPIDLLVYDAEGVHFVEVKSGYSGLSNKQRKIRDQIKEGKVTFETYRIKGEQ